MKARSVVGFVVCFFLILSAPGIYAAGHGKVRPVKTGILLVTFGSSMPQAQVSFENIDQKVRAAFPDIQVRWAFTSHMIRHKLAKQGKQLDSVALALARMMDEGFTHVAIQSLHTIAGEEFHDLLQTAHAFRGMPEGFDRILVGAPLLAGEKDLAGVREAIIRHIPGERKDNEAVVLMGHGTQHPSNAVYAAMMYHFQRKDPNIFVGTVEGAPEIGEIKDMLLQKGIKTAYLMPFMSVAGDHARNDMAGDEADSWKSVLTGAGITCVPVLKGTAEYDDIVAIWVDHLRTTLTNVKK
jgi:sirohydrochlorin cobaltochelatase